MKIKSTLVVLTIGTLIAATFSARAQLIAYEDFNYMPGTQMAALNGGGGWATPWSLANTSIATNFSPGLSYSTLPGSGGGVVFGYPDGWPTSGGQTANAERLLPNTFGNLAASGSGTLWVSFLFQNWNTDQAGLPGYREAKLMLFSGATTNGSGNANVNGSEKLDAGSPNTYAAGASDTLSLWQGSTYASSGIATPRGTAPSDTVWIVLRLDVDNTTAADTAYMWVDPSLTGGDPNTASAVSFNLNDLSGVNALRFQAGNLNSSGTNAVFAADELRVGYSFNDLVTAVPEPSSVAFVVSFVGVGIAFLIVRKRINRAQV